MPPTDSPPRRRPGGLTALAVLSITLGILGLMLGGIGYSALYHDRGERERSAEQFERMATSDLPPDRSADAQLQRAMVQGIAASSRTISHDAYRLMFALGVTSAVLMLISALGFLGMKRLMGFHIGLASAIALIACGVTAMFGLPFLFWGLPMLGAMYGMVLIIMLLALYRPVLTQ